MASDDSAKERKIMMLMRKTLAQVIKDTTPEYKSMRHPLSERTIQDIRDCLQLISARERELAELHRIEPEKPYFTDEKPAAKVVPISSLGTRKPGDDDSSQ